MRTDAAHLLPRRCIATVAAAAVGLGAVVASGGVEPSPFRPVSVLTASPVLHDGTAFVPLADLARALGGTGRYDPAHRRYEIEPGSGGVLAAGSGRLSTPASRAPALTLRLGACEIAIPDAGAVLLRPAGPAISIAFLARLLGGQASRDPRTGAWLLPAGGPATPLRFR